MLKFIPVADDDVCLTAVKVYVEKLQEAGLPVEICDAAADAEWEGESLACIAWGNGDEPPAGDEEFADFSEDDGRDHLAFDPAPAVAEQYTRNLLYLGTNPRAAEKWLLNNGRTQPAQTKNNLCQMATNER
ncbi:MAG: hypothetical protein ABSG67_04050 [Thermoguttaceae bacterium]|jgi:hypothetical protein